MKSLVGALVLLLQFQPLLGAVACLDLVVQPANQECSMSDHGTAVRHGVSEPVTRPAPNCALASLCAPASLAVPVAAGRLETAILLQTGPAISGNTRPLDVSSAPPFHPPRV